MQTTTTTPAALRRTRAMARLAILAALSGVFVALFSVPSQAADSATTQSSTAATGDYSPSEADASYVRVGDPAPYLNYWQALAGDVLHVDTAHASAEGFWYAAAGSASDRPGERNFRWIYQPYGIKCSGTAAEVVYNPWTNFYSCLLNVETAQAMDPASQWTTHTPACRAERPWSAGWAIPNGSECFNDALWWTASSAQFAPNHEYYCAPWETDQYGHACMNEGRYTWEKKAEAAWFNPAPDACTGAPANLQTLPAGYGSHQVTTVDPSCDGSAPAPNCTPAQANHVACGGPVPFGLKTGWPEHSTSTGGETGGETGGTGTSVTIVATMTATGQAHTAMETSTRTAKAKAARGYATATKVRYYQGRKFVGTARAKIVVSRTATATRTSEVTQNASPATATRSCTRDTEEEARTCAEQAALAQAEHISTTTARDAAISTARAYAHQAAGAAAKQQARDRAQTSRLTDSDTANARDKAARAAQRAVDRKVRAYINR